MSGPVNDARSNISPQRLRFTPRILWGEEKNPPVLSPPMSPRSVMDAILTLEASQRNMLLGKFRDLDRKQLISLGWRVTPTRKKID